MNLLDVELKTQGVDIKLPGYWYKYGFYVDLNFLDIVLPRKFTKNYVLDNTIVPAVHTRKDYKIEPDIKRKVDLNQITVSIMFSFMTLLSYIFESEEYRKGYTFFLIAACALDLFAIFLGRDFSGLVNRL